MLIDMWITASLALLASAGFVLVRNRSIRATWHRAPAVVTANVERSVGGGNHDVFPVFTFLTGQYGQVSVQQHASRPRFQVGERVDVLHHPGDPRQVKVDHWMAWHLVPALMGLGGLVSLVAFLVTVTG